MKLRLPITSFFIFMIITVFSIQVHSENEGDPFEEIDQQEYGNCVKEEEKYHHNDAIKVHFDYYYELLIEKHQQQISEEWNEVLRERDAIHKTLKEACKEGKIEELHGNEAWEGRHREYEEAFYSAVKAKDYDKIKLLLPKRLELQKEWNAIHKQVLQDNQ